MAPPTRTPAPSGGGVDESPRRPASVRPEGTKTEPPVRLVGGIAVHNDARGLRRSVDSLLRQLLPADAAWRQLWIVSSGSTDGSVAIGEALAREDARVRLLVEPERRGKSAALAEIFARAEGTHLVLLNADDIAEPGSVAALLSAARGLLPPFAVMGRPVPDREVGALGKALRLMYELHHGLHRRVLTGGEGTHLSDNLLLLSLAARPPLTPGIINDGAYVGAWLRTHHGTLRYAPEARVRLDVPASWADHLVQRRRIQVGHRQVSRLTGVRPTTLPAFTRRHPLAAAQLLREAIQEQPEGLPAFLTLLGGEIRAFPMSIVDQLGGRDHVRWTRITPAQELPRTPTVTVRTFGSEAPSSSVE